MSKESDRVESLAESVAEERARIDETVKNVQRKLTPGQLIDEVLLQGSEPARNALAALGKTASAHPIPIILMGAALLWLALEHNPRKDS